MLAVGLLLTQGHGLVVALYSQILKTFKGRDAMTSLDNLLECCTSLLANRFFLSIQSESSQPKLTVLPLLILSGTAKKSLALILSALEVTIGSYWVTTSLLFTTLNKPTSLQVFTKVCCHQTNGIAFLQSFLALLFSFLTSQLWLLQFFHFPFMSPTLLFPRKRLLWKHARVQVFFAQVVWVYICLNTEC